MCAEGVELVKHICIILGIGTCSGGNTVLLHVVNNILSCSESF